MTHRKSVIGLLITSFVASMVLAGQPALAQRLINEGPPPDDPILAWSQYDAPRNQFFLDSSDDVELVRYKRAHDLDICAARGDPKSIDGTKHGYPIKISWDAQTAVVKPGNCMSFEAQRVSVRPASDLPDNVILTGTVRIVR